MFRAVYYRNWGLKCFFKKYIKIIFFLFFKINTLKQSENIKKNIF